MILWVSVEREKKGVVMCSLAVSQQQPDSNAMKSQRTDGGGGGYMGDPLYKILLRMGAQQILKQNDKRAETRHLIMLKGQSEGCLPRPMTDLQNVFKKNKLLASDIRLR